MRLYVFFAASALLSLGSLKQQFNSPDDLLAELNFITKAESSCNQAYKITFNSTVNNDVDIDAVRRNCPDVKSSCCSSQQVKDLESYSNFAKKTYQHILKSDNFFMDSMYQSCLESMVSLVDELICFTCDNDKQMNNESMKNCLNISPNIMKENLPKLLNLLMSSKDFLKHKEKFPLISKVFSFFNVSNN
jgi:hypothetical protein